MSSVLTTSKRLATATASSHSRAHQSRRKEANMKSMMISLISAVLLSALVMAAAVDSPVARAAMQGDKRTVESLLKGGADVNAALNDGMTALHWAADRGYTDIAEMLVYAGANPNAMTRIGQYTPLHLASKGGNSAIVNLLI